MFKFIVALGLATTAIAAAPAEAATFVLSDVGPDIGASIFGNKSKTSGLFSDDFKFSVPTGSLSAFVGSIALSSKLDVVLKNVVLDGVTVFHQDLTGYEEKWSLADTLISAGDHVLTVSGKWGTKGGAYSGTINYAPVPEPANWALMMAGFGLVGAAMRRRNLSTVLA